MTSYPLEQLIREASSLPPIPQTVQKALAVIRDPNANAAGLARILAADQVLAARVLRWANSAYYGLESQIGTIQQAITVLGLELIQEVIMTCSVADYLNQPLPGYGLASGELWKHALGTAVGAQLISRQHHLQIDEEAYFAGLLCDLGKLIFEKHFRQVDLSQAELDRPSFLEVERARFGIDHAGLGAELARQWQLPENLVTAIAFHHEPRWAPEHKTLAAAIHVADITMQILGVGLGVDGQRYPLEQVALQGLDMRWEDLFPLAEQVEQQLEHVKESVRRV